MAFHDLSILDLDMVVAEEMKIAVHEEMRQMIA